MKLSNVAFFTLAALVAQDSVSEASPLPETPFSSSPSQVLETDRHINEIQTVSLQPTTSVSQPETFSVQEFSPSRSQSTANQVIVASAIPALTSASQIPSLNQQKLNQVLDQTWLALLVETFSSRRERRLSSNINIAATNPSLIAQASSDTQVNSDFNHTITLLNSLLIIAILSPIITVAFFWFARRLVIRELVTEANRSLNRVNGLEDKITASCHQSQQIAQELKLQIKVAQESINFLKTEASASQASIEQLKQLQLNLLQSVQKLESNFKSNLQTREQSNLIQFPVPDNQNLDQTPQLKQDYEGGFQFNSSPNFIADDYLKQAEGLANEQRYPEALSALKKATQMNPNLEEAWYSQGNILVRLSRYTEALSAYEKVVEIHPDKYEAWYNRGNVLVKLKKYSEALESYNQALSIQPNDDEAWHNRGVLLRKFKRYKDALLSYDKALEIQPNKYETWHNRGNVLGKLKRYEEAIISYDRAITIDAGKREVWLNRAVALCKLKRYEQAIASFEQAIGLDPNSPELWTMRGSLLQQIGQYSEAIASFENALHHHPDYYEALLGKGSVFVQLKQYSEALTIYKKAIEIQPDTSEAWRHQGLLFEKLEQYSDAINAYDRAIKLKPNDAEAWRFRGALLSKLKNYPEAISSLGKAISIQKELRSVKTITSPEVTSASKN
ncbi:MAG: tetratricopeptide repeat protein [Cyanobacteria bacterium J06592_8]